MMKSMEDSGIKISEGILKRVNESASNTERPSKSAPKQSRFLSRKLVSSDIHKGIFVSFYLDSSLKSFSK